MAHTYIPARDEYAPYSDTDGPSMNPAESPDADREPCVYVTDEAQDAGISTRPLGVVAVKVVSEDPIGARGVAYEKASIKRLAIRQTTISPSSRSV